MSDGRIVDRLERFRALVGIEPESPWVRAPASDAEIHYVERALGYVLPEDLRALLEVQNGGRVLGAEEWIPCVEDRGAGLLAYKEILDGVLTELAAAQLLVGWPPGRRTLQVTAASQVGILYDLDEVPGRLLYLDMTASSPVVPLSRDLSTLVDAYVALAEAGLVEVGLQGPLIKGSPEVVRAILVEHKVADVASSGIDSWLLWPGASDFSID